MIHSRSCTMTVPSASSPKRLGIYLTFQRRPERSQFGFLDSAHPASLTTGLSHKVAKLNDHSYIRLSDHSGNSRHREFVVNLRILSKPARRASSWTPMVPTMKSLQSYESSSRRWWVPFGSPSSCVRPLMKITERGCGQF